MTGYLPDIMGTIETAFTIGDPNPADAAYNANTITLSNEAGVLAIRDANNVNLVSLKANLIGGTIDGMIIGSTTPAVAFFAISDTQDSLTSWPLTVSHLSTDHLPIAGFGVGILFQADDSTTVNSLVGEINAAWTNAVHGSRSGEFDFYLSNTSGNVLSMVVTPTGINSTVIGATTPAAITGTTIQANTSFTLNDGGGPAAFHLENGATARGDLAIAEGSSQYAAGTSAGDIVLRTAAGALWFDTNNGSGTPAIKIAGGNGATRVRQGLATGTAALAGAIFDHFADVNNTTTGETDLYTDTTPANALGSNGDCIHARYSGVVATNGNTKDIRIYFAGTKIFDSGLQTFSNLNWTFEVWIIRETSAIVRTAVVGIWGSTAFSNTLRITGLTLSGTNIIKITGQSGTASSDITATSGKVEWQSAA